MRLWNIDPVCERVISRIFSSCRVQHRGFVYMMCVTHKCVAHNKSQNRRRLQQIVAGTCTTSWCRQNSW